MIQRIKSTKELSERGSRKNIQMDLKSVQVEIDEGDKESLLVKLKDIHMKEQGELVSSLKQMNQESKKIIDDITIMEDQIQKYQLQIEGWMKNISELQNFVSKVRTVKDPFKRKADNMGKLRDYLNVEKGKRR